MIVWARDRTGVDTPAKIVNATQIASTAVVAPGTRSRVVDGARSATAESRPYRPALAMAARSEPPYPSSLSSPEPPVVTAGDPVAAGMYINRATRR